MLSKYFHCIIPVDYDVIITVAELNMPKKQIISLQISKFSEE